MIEDVIRQLIFYTLVSVIVISYWMYLKKTYENINLSFLIFMFFYRIPLIFIYTEFIPGDWVDYMRYLNNEKEIIFNFGTDSIPWLAELFLSQFSLDLYGYFFAFSLTGYFGVATFYVIIHKLLGNNDNLVFSRFKIFPWLLLYPSLHMYTVMLGKDPIVFYGVALVTLGLSKQNINWLLLTCGILLAILVRPHMGAILTIALLLSLFFNRKYGYFTKTMILGMLVGGAVAIIPKITSLFRVKTLSIEAILTAIETNGSYVNDAGTYIDMSSYPLPLKMFTYLFRPLFIDSPNVLLLEYSAENLVFIILLFTNLRLAFFSWLKKQSVVVVFSFIYFMIGAMVLCNGLTVFGLFIRQKTMIFLNFVLLLCVYMNYLKNKQLVNNNNNI